MSKILSLADIESLPSLRTQEVPVPEWGGSFVVRELSRDEMHHASTLEAKDAAAFERWTLETAVVEPSLTPALIDRIMRSAGAIKIVDRLSDAIATLSGMTAEAEKSAEKSFRDEPREDL